MQKSIISALLLASQIVAGCGGSNQSQLKLVNGQKLAANDWPQVLALKANSALNPNYCSSVLVASRQLLTAAHCVIANTAAELEIIGTPAQVVSISLNDNFSFQDNRGVNGSDLALLTLDRSLSIEPASFYQGEISKGISVEVVGFGLSGNLQPTSAGTKRIGRNTLVSVGATLGFVGASATTTATGDNVSTAKGDSGGPLFIEGKLAGITTGGATVGDFRYSAYVEFTNNGIAQLSC